MRLSLLIRALPLLILLAMGNIVLAQSLRPDNRPRNCSISGRLTVGGNPLSNKIVIASELPDQNSFSAGDISVSLDGVSTPAHSARTDADGRYRIIGLPAGKYDVRPQAKSYVPDKKSGTTERSVTLEDGETEENVDFALMRGGVITGRVSDAEDRPLIEQRVEMTLVDEDGQKRPYGGDYTGEMTSTDDRGVYRLYGIPAGRYLVSTSGGRFVMAGQMTSKHPRTFHPNVTEEAQARIVEVTEGGEATGIDIRLGTARKTFEAIGRVVDAETGRPVPQASLMCIGTGSKDGALRAFSGTANSDTKGEFRFAGLQPGQYTLQLTPGFGAFMGKQSEHYAEEVKFEVTSSDVSGIEMRAKLGASISGVVVMDAAQAQKGKINLGQMMLSAVSQKAPENAADPASEAMFSPFNFNIAKLNMDGSFRITGLPPGRVEFQLVNIGSAAPVVTRVERNGALLGEGIEVRAGEAVTGVKVVLAYATGVIRGQVNVTGGPLSAGWRIMAMVRTLGTSSGGHGGAAEVDNKGRFVIGGLLDGEYDVTVRALTNNADPGQPPTASQTVRVANGAEVQVTFTLDLGKKQEE